MSHAVTPGPRIVPSAHRLYLSAWTHARAHTRASAAPFRARLPPDSFGYATDNYTTASVGPRQRAGGAARGRKRVSGFNKVME